MTTWTSKGHPVEPRHAPARFDPLPRNPDAIDIHALDIAERRAKARERAHG